MGLSTEEEAFRQGEAKNEQSRKDAGNVLAARKEADDAFLDNLERLKAERLARKAAGKIHILLEGESTPRLRETSWWLEQ